MAVRCVPFLDAPCLANRFFSGGLRLRAQVRAQLVRRCVLASAGRCIQHGRPPRERVRWVWARHCRLRERRGLAAVRAGQRDGPVSAMFRAE